MGSVVEELDVASQVLPSHVEPVCALTRQIRRTQAPELCWHALLGTNVYADIEFGSYTAARCA